MMKLIAWLLEPFYFKTLLPYLGATGMILYGGGGKGGGGDAPDMTALAAATEKAAELGYKLGNEQLAENKRQYEINTAMQRPISEAQAGLMYQTIDQGNDYFNYMQQFSRPVEMSLFYDAMGFNADEINQINSAREAAVSQSSTASNQKYQQDLARWQQEFDAVKASIPSTTAAPKVEVVKPDGAMTGAELAKQFGAVTPGGIPLVRDAYSQLLYRREQTLDPNQYYTRTKKAGGFVYTPVAVQYKVSEGSTANPEYSAKLTEVLNRRPTYDENQTVDYGQANNLAVKLGITAQDRVKAQEAAKRDVINQKSNDLAARIGETDTQVYNRYADDIEAEAGQAVADSRAGFTNAINMAARQGLRYGYSPAKLAAMATTQSVDQGAKQAAAANQTRKTATQTMYGRGVGAAQQGLTGAVQNRSMEQQDEALRYAKKLDTAGLYRGLPGASQGAYNTAISAGNAAVGNQMAPSGLYMQGINQGNNTIMNGVSQQIQGLSNIAQMQTSIANSRAGQDNGLWGALGTVAGAGISKWSDRRLKRNIRQIGKHASGLAIYEFDYLWGEHAYGFMADEVIKVKPEAVSVADNGFMMVDYGQF